MPRITEIARAIEPVTHDPFIDDLYALPASPESSGLLDRRCSRRRRPAYRGRRAASGTVARAAGAGTWEGSPVPSRASVDHPAP